MPYFLNSIIIIPSNSKNIIPPIIIASAPLTNSYPMYPPNKPPIYKVIIIIYIFFSLAYPKNLENYTSISFYEENFAKCISNLN